jgi:hypothetical protein
MIKIESLGHFCGFHPGYHTFNDEIRWISEKKAIEKNLSHDLVMGRQHYLRYSTPETWRIWDKFGMKIDSSLSFASHEGFRAGTGDSFRVFDVIQRQKLNLMEMPLVIMDVTLVGKAYKGLDVDQSVDLIKSYIDIAKNTA